MKFRATNFTDSVFLLVAFTIFMIGVRNKKSLDNNWPMIYWLLVFIFTISRPEDSFDYRYVLIGVLAAMLLRFEFMNDAFVKVFRTVELAAFIYVILRGLQVAFF
jgi:hypothetical protein